MYGHGGRDARIRRGGEVRLDAALGDAGEPDARRIDILARRRDSR